MQSWEKYTDSGQKFDFLLFDNFSNHCLANTVEPLRAANMLTQQPLYHWRFLTLDGAPVESSSGMQVAQHGTLENGTGKTLFIMPSYGFRDLGSWNVSKQLLAASKRYDYLAGLDTGSWLLAVAGLLDGHCATIHWEELTTLPNPFQISIRSESVT